MPKSYADKFARAVTVRSEIRVIPDAGHLAELDKPGRGRRRDHRLDDLIESPLLQPGEGKNHCWRLR